MNAENAETKAPVDRLVMRCDLCRWWQRHDDFLQTATNKEDESGYCVRYPPVQNIQLAIETSRKTEDGTDPTDAVMNTYNWVRPVTAADEMCGEFQA
jgi:hypothetical protein